MSSANLTTMSEINKNQSKKKPIRVGYHLFLYREELRKPISNQRQRSKVKYQLTNDLVVTTCHNIEYYPKEERSHLINSMAYKSKLKLKLEKKSKKGSSGNSKKSS